MKLQDKVSIVTGASSGIGKAPPRALAQEGWSVVLAARRADILEAVAEDIEATVVQAQPPHP